MTNTITTERIFDDLEFEISAFAPTTSGVYAVYIVHDWLMRETDKYRLVYIGASKNIKKRLQTDKHPYSQFLIRRRRRISNFHVFCKFYECEDCFQLEAKLISLYRPLLNKKSKSNGKKI